MGLITSQILGEVHVMYIFLSEGFANNNNNNNDNKLDILGGSLITQRCLIALLQKRLSIHIFIIILLVFFNP